METSCVPPVYQGMLHKVAAGRIWMQHMKLWMWMRKGQRGNCTYMSEPILLQIDMAFQCSTPSRRPVTLSLLHMECTMRKTSIGRGYSCIQRIETHRKAEKRRKTKKQKQKKGEKSRGEQKKHPVSEETKGSLEEKKPKKPQQNRGGQMCQKYQQIGRWERKLVVPRVLMYEWMEKYIDKCRNKLFYYKKKRDSQKKRVSFQGKNKSQHI